MAKIVILGPKKEKRIRVSLDVTPKEILQAATFKPESTKIQEEIDGSKKLLFVTKPSPKEGSIGRYGIAVPQSDPEEKVEFTQTFTKETEDYEIVALISNVSKHLDTLENQIKEANKELAEAAKEIKEV